MVVIKLHGWRLRGMRTIHMLFMEFLRNMPCDTGVEKYFQGLPSYLGVPADMPLPWYNSRVFSKSVWDISMASVKGVANLVLSYGSIEYAMHGDFLLTCCPTLCLLQMGVK